MDLTPKSKFKPGDKVRILHCGEYYYGEVTLISHRGEPKVLFSEGEGLDYWYYKDEELELVEEKDVKDA